MTSEHSDFDAAEQLLRIRRALDESDKFRAEQRKRMAESDKFHAEQLKLFKLFAEGLKLERGRWLAPVAMSVAAVGAVTAAVASILNLFR
jgi:hypothetical protein